MSQRELRERNCAICGMPAACVGAYDGDERAYACDSCCGHACEDGHCDSLEFWEPLAPSRRMWTVINVEGLEPHPLAIFADEEDAKEWIATRTKDCDSDRYHCNPVFMSAHPSTIVGEFWNSYDAAPDEAAP